MLINVQQDATIHILLLYKCFGWFHHASSGAQITVSTASGTGQPLLLPGAIVTELKIAIVATWRYCGGVESSSCCYLALSWWS